MESIITIMITLAGLITWLSINHENAYKRIFPYLILICGLVIISVIAFNYGYNKAYKDVYLAWDLIQNDPAKVKGLGYGVTFSLKAIINYIPNWFLVLPSIFIGYCLLLLNRKEILAKLNT